MLLGLKVSQTNYQTPTFYSVLVFSKVTMSWSDQFYFGSADFGTCLTECLIGLKIYYFYFYFILTLLSFVNTKGIKGEYLRFTCHIAIHMRHETVEYVPATVTSTKSGLFLKNKYICIKSNLLRHVTHTINYMKDATPVSVAHFSFPMCIPFLSYYLRFSSVHCSLRM